MLVPFWLNDQYFRLLSTNTFFVLFPLALLAGDLVHQRRPIVPSPITILLVFACAALLVGVVRYGTVAYLRYPQILIQATVLFFLGLSLFRTRQQLVTLVLVLAVAFTLRNSIELVENWSAFQAGNPYSTIRIEEHGGGGFFRTLSTGQSAFRGFMLPIFVAMFIYAQNRTERILLGAAIISSAAWIGISGTRIGTLSVVIGLLLLMWRMPGKRGALSVWLGLLVATMLATALMFPDMLKVTLQHFDNIIFGGERRVTTWKYAFEGFLLNPAFGSRIGPHHSYLLGRAQEMGLVFMLPFALALWRVWSHTAWMRLHQVDPSVRAFAIGLQAGILTAVFQNFIGTGWQVGEYALIFWLLIGVHEALYYHSRRAFQRDFAPSVPTQQMNEPRL